MSSRSPKKPPAPSKCAFPVPPTRRGQGKRAAKPPVLGDNGSLNEELVLSLSVHPTHKAKNVEMADADAAVARRNPIPVPKAVKIEKQAKEIVELTSSDDAQEIQNDFRPSTGVNARTKKRVIEDAAIFLDNDDVSVIESPPKKSRRNATKVVLDASDYDLDDVFDIVDVDQPSGDVESLSVSPLKLNRSNADNNDNDNNNNNNNDNDEFDSFIDDDDLSEPLINKTNAKGKKKAIYILQDLKDEHTNEELHPDEVVAIVKAIEQSRQQLPMHQDAGKSTAGPSAAGDQHIMLVKAEPVHFNPGNAGPVVGGSSITDMPARKTFRDLFPQPQTTPLMSAGIRKTVIYY